MSTPEFVNKWSDKDVEKHWDDVASIYIKENNRVKDAHDQRFIESVKYLDLTDGMKVINITSRDCEANDYILKENKKVEVINTEISAGLIAEANKARPYVKQVKIETYSELPFENNTFDRVLSLETLEHVKEPVQFLKELNRVSSRDARMVLSCPPATSEIPYRIYTALFGGHGEGPHRFPPSKRVKKMFELSGWKLLMHKGTVLMPVGPPFLKKWGEKIINKCQGTWISELGIRQFYVCEKQ
ncbi:MAG: methyltransferase domain-containing protein [Candidatus Delongbacteria bacterium]|jgi:SAM-dependent methyltransferase|nr:methyltransferase domain-containing protein [Candidatus Delongbacteria bacterium]